MCQEFQAHLPIAEPSRLLNQPEFQVGGCGCGSVHKDRGYPIHPNTNTGPKWENVKFQSNQFGAALFSDKPMWNHRARHPTENVRRGHKALTTCMGSQQKQSQHDIAFFWSFGRVTVRWPFSKATLICRNMFSIEISPRSSIRPALFTRRHQHSRPNASGHQQLIR